MINKVVYILLIITVLLTGCVYKPVYLMPNFAPPARIAVLPFANNTVDMAGPEVLRKLAIKKMESKGYILEETDTIDSKLREEGITNAGQLQSITDEELGKLFNVDAVLYGTVLEFNYTTLGIYYKRAVKARFKLVNTHTGETIWEDERTSYHDEIVTRNIKDALLEQLKEKAVDKLLRLPLMQESHEVVNSSFLTLPSAR